MLFDQFSIKKRINFLSYLALLFQNTSTMEEYRNRNEKSMVQSYEIGGDHITILFRNAPEIYTFSYQSAGTAHVEKMKVLAKNGLGLNGYIMVYVKYDFER